MKNYKIKKRSGTGVWYVSWFENGKRSRQSLKTTKKSEAERIVESIRKKDFLGEDEFCQDNPSDLKWICEEYVNWSRNIKHNCEKTISTDKIAMKLFLTRAKIDDVKSINKKVIDDVIKQLKLDQKAPATINSVIRVWRSICNRAIEWKVIEENPFKGYTRFKTPEKKHTFCNEEQRAMFMNYAERFGRNIHIACALGFYAGMRKKEISYAKWDWFDFEEGLIHIYSSDGFVTKSKKNRTIKMFSELEEILLKYQNGQKDGYVFAHGRGTKTYKYDFRKPFDRIREYSGLHWVTPHIMRHTFASILAQANVSLFKIQNWLGHSDISVTQIYAHLQSQDDDIEKLKGAL